MLDRSNSNGVLVSIQGLGEEFAVFLVVLFVTVLGLGYAGGSVLAGETVAAQSWVLPILGLGVVLSLVLYAESRNA